MGVGLLLHLELHLILVPGVGHLNQIRWGVIDVPAVVFWGDVVGQIALRVPLVKDLCVVYARPLALGLHLFVDLHPSLDCRSQQIVETTAQISGAESTAHPFSKVCTSCSTCTFGEAYPANPDFVVGVP